MRKLMLNTAIASALALASFAGQAAESATFTVTGTITPATCDVSLSTPSIDLGNIPASTLTEDTNYKTGEDVILSVDCDAAAATAIRTTDNRTSSAMTAEEVADQMKVPLENSNLAAQDIFGLGTDSAQNKVGALTIGIRSATSDGVANNNLFASSDKAAWQSRPIGSNGQAVAKNNYFGLASSVDATGPSAYTRPTYTIGSMVLLKKGNLYPAGEAVPIDGNITFSVFYL
ncbi:DUF1120 domain-containing protein [Pantoea sp. NSTU24]|uniref:DUF1120 domain-containing protein n=1 Tax=Pantoea sp. NSTU24 TaxID=3391144 RepID=UPI003CFC9BB2